MRASVAEEILPNIGPAERRRPSLCGRVCDGRVTGERSDNGARQWPSEAQAEVTVAGRKRSHLVAPACCWLPAPPSSTLTFALWLLLPPRLRRLASPPLPSPPFSPSRYRRPSFHLRFSAPSLRPAALSSSFPAPALHSESVVYVCSASLRCSVNVQAPYPAHCIPA